MEGRDGGPAMLRGCLGLPGAHLRGEGEARDGGGCVGTAAPAVPASPAVQAAPGHESQAQLGSELLSASGASLRARAGLGHPGAGSAPEKPAGPGMAGRLPPQPSPTSRCQPLPPAPSLTWRRLCSSGSPSWGWERAFALCFAGIFGVLCRTPATGTQGRCCLLTEPLSWEWPPQGSGPRRAPTVRTPCHNGLWARCGPWSQRPGGRRGDAPARLRAAPWGHGSSPNHPKRSAVPSQTASPVQPRTCPPPWQQLPQAEVMRRAAPHGSWGRVCRLDPGADGSAGTALGGARRRCSFLGRPCFGSPPPLCIPSCSAGLVQMDGPWMG